MCKLFWFNIGSFGSMPCTNSMNVLCKALLALFVCRKRHFDTRTFFFQGFRVSIAFNWWRMFTSSTQSINNFVIKKWYLLMKLEFIFLPWLVIYFIYCQTKFKQNEFICILIPHPPFQIFHMEHQGLRFGMIIFMLHISHKCWTNTCNLW